jgi:hypothetical protein
VEQDFPLAGCALGTLNVWVQLLTVASSQGPYLQLRLLCHCLLAVRFF